MGKFLGVNAPASRLVLSYVFDWIVIVAIAAVGAGLDYTTPFHRPFSPVDLSISFPFQTHEKIPTHLLVLIALVAPAVITFVVCMLLVPGSTATRGTPSALLWRRRLWEWNTAWMGLCLSLASAFFITQGMKHLFGKPRPDLLSRCKPDLSLDALRNAAVNNIVGDTFNMDWILVTSDICTTTDHHLLKDGFRSFPSGHSSFSWAGLLYLTLFLASKFSVTIPFLPPRPYSVNPAYTSATAPSNLKKVGLPFHKQDSTLSSLSYPEELIVPIRYQNAAPPVYTIIIMFFPIGAAIYIVSTRFTDFRHFGFDILFGSLIGIICSWFSFRFYHLPITRGAGWSWGPRSYNRAWGIGVGTGSYVGTEGWSKSIKTEVALGMKGEGHETMAENEMELRERAGGADRRSEGIAQAV